MASTVNDSELKARHAAMWASGDYPGMVSTFLTPLGDVLVDAIGVADGDAVLDVASGTGNAAVPAARAGAQVTATDLTPELLEAGEAAAAAEGVTLDWRTADAERLPFEDDAYDVVMSCIGVMFAPHHQDAADELVRVTKPGGKVGLLSWTPQGQIGQMLKAIGPFAPAPPPGASPPPLWGSEEHLDELFGERVTFTTLRRGVLRVDAWATPAAYTEHFKAKYGPTIAAQNNARKTGREDEFIAAFDAFAADWNRGTSDRAWYDLEYLVAVGTKTA